MDWKKGEKGVQKNFVKAEWVSNFRAACGDHGSYWKWEDVFYECTGESH